MSTTEKQKISKERRAFLKLTGAGVAAGGAAAVLGGGAVGQAEAAATPTRGAGYRETAHVKKAYETARF